MKSRKRIRARSEKRIASLPARAAIIDQALQRDRYQCQAEPLVPSVRCGGPLDAHERIPRSVWPGGELVLDNTVIVCRRHHEWIDANPAAAWKAGLHGKSWERSRGEGA